MKREAFSSSWKPSRVSRDLFQRLETFPHVAWPFPASGNLPACRVSFSQVAKTGCPWDGGLIFGIARRNPYLRGQEKKLEQNGETF